MTDEGIRAERGRALEEEYFQKKDKELIEKMRRAAMATEARAKMGEKTAVTDPDMLQELEALGFTPETIVLLPSYPSFRCPGPKVGSRQPNAA